MKSTIGFLLLAIALVGCGKSAQEKVAEEQLKKMEAAKNVMGDGNKPMTPRGNKNSLTDK